MAINQELSSVVEDRVFKSCRESEVEIAFQDGSTMKFVIGCEDGTTLSLQLIEPGNSVSVRDKDGAVEYRG